MSFRLPGGILGALVTAIVLIASWPVLAGHLDVDWTPGPVWVKEPGVRIALGPGDPAGTTGFHTPYAFRFPDGTLRMYYDANVPGTTLVQSAVSADGLAWTKEVGTRVMNAAHPHVLAVAGGYRMYWESAGPVAPFVGSSFSVDGLAWTAEPGVRLASAVDPVVVELPGGGLRMYVRMGLAIRSALSSDGLSWALEAGNRLSDAREFAIVRAPSGLLVLYYGQATPPFQSIRSARSSDGLTFTLDAAPALLPGPVGAPDYAGVLTTSILQFPGGVLRMYYQGGPDPTNINRDSQVFSAVQGPPPCPRTHGYWKNHRAAWPVSSLALGSQTYTSSELLSLLGRPSRGDASVILAHQLIAAKLNVFAGSDPGPIDDVLVDAEALLATHSGKLPYGVKARSPEGQSMIALARTLDAYNNGGLTEGC